MPNNRQNIVNKNWLSVVLNAPDISHSKNKMFDLSCVLNTGSSGRHKKISKP